MPEAKMIYKILTHDYRSPVRGGEPVWDGVTLPMTLPKVELDTGPEECARGWNYVKDLEVGLRITGFWPTGRPVVAFEVSPSADAVTRGDKCRCSRLKLLRLLGDAEVEDAICRVSAVFGLDAGVMATEQVRWRRALCRPRRDVGAIKAGLLVAVEARGLRWAVHRYDNPQGVRTSWMAISRWEKAHVREAWEPRTVGAAWQGRAEYDEWRVGYAWSRRLNEQFIGISSMMLVAGDAMAASAALVQFLAARRGWVSTSPELLTIGLRDAYENGAEIVCPVGRNVLGWA